MTRSEYQELVEFLSKKFDAIDGRLSKVEVGLEENRHQTQTLAEGLTSLRSEMRRGFDSVWVEIRGLSGRIDRLEARGL
jgi:hypothetical protein